MVDDELRDMEDEIAPPPKKGKLPIIIIAAVIVAVVGVGGYFAGKMTSGDDNNKQQQTVEKDNPDKKQTPTEKTTAQTPDNGTKEEPGVDINEDNVSNGSSETNTTTPAHDKGNRGVLALDAFTVNLNDPFGRRYVECILNLVLDDRSLVPKIKENELLMAKIRHEIFMTLSSKSYDELKSMSGKVTLFEEIMMRVNEILKEEMGVEPVVEVLQTKFLMQ